MRLLRISGMFFLLLSIFNLACGKEEKKESELFFGSLKRITSTGGNYPHWSPDGNLIVYSWDNRVYTITPEGTDSTVVATMENGSVTEPHWNPAGSNQICFINHPSGQNVWEIYTMTLGEEPVLVYSEKKQISSISFTRDGSEIAFCYDPGSTAGIMLIPATGGTATKWPRDETWGKVSDAECAVDADMISFLELRQRRNWDIYTLPRTGGKATRITDFSGEQDCTKASRSWDGTKYCIRYGIHFYWTEFNLYIMDAQGGKVEQLTKSSVKARALYPDNPAWSPDGNKIVFARQEYSGSPYDLYVVDLTK